MLIKDGSAPDKMSDGHRTYSGNDFTTRHWHFGKKSEKVLEGTCLACVFDEGSHDRNCVFRRELLRKVDEEALEKYSPENIHLEAETKTIRRDQDGNLKW